MSTHTMTRLLNPKPNQNPMIGTTARIGMVWSTTAYGYNDRSTHLAWLIAMATAIPMAIAAIARPIIATLVDSQSALSNSTRLSGSRNATCTTACGGGTRKRRSRLSSR